VIDSAITSLSIDMRKVLETGSVQGEINPTLHFANGKEAKVTGADCVISDPTIASIVKPVPGLALLETMHEGKLRIDCHYLGFSAYQDVTIKPPKNTPKSIYIGAIAGFDGDNITTRPIHMIEHRAPLMFGISMKKGGSPTDQVSASMLQWSVSDPSIIGLEAVKVGAVEVPLQKVVAKKVGRAEVRVSYGSLQASTTILVHPPSDAQLKIIVKKGTVRVGDEISPVLFHAYHEGMQKIADSQASVQWRSSNEQVLSITHDKRSRVHIQAIAEGEAVLYANDGMQEVSTKVYVSAKPTGIYFLSPRLSLKVKQKASLRNKLRISYSDGFHRRPNYQELDEITLTTENHNTLNVLRDNDVVATGIGQTQLHIAWHEFATNIAVEVQAEEMNIRPRKVPVSIAISTTNHELPLGSSGSIHAQLTFDDGSQPKRTGNLGRWTSSKPSVIEISPEGYYRALAAGEADITVLFGDNNNTLTDTQHFVVPQVHVNHLSLEQDAIQLPVNGKYEYLDVWAELAHGERKYVSPFATFVMEDETIARIKNDGTIVAKKAGSSLVHVRYAGQVAQFTLYIYDAMPPASMDCGGAETVQMMANEVKRVDCRFSYQDPHVHYTPEASTWRVVTSSDPSIVQVSEKSLLAMQTGTAIITVQAGQLRELLQVTVSEGDLMRRELIAPDQIKVRTQEPWSLIEYYSNGLQRKCRERAASSNEQVLSRNGNTVIGEAIGQATLHAYCKGAHYQKDIVVIANDTPAATQDRRR
jgi:hypothetical protein